MKQKISALKDLAAAYEAALNYDYCPQPDDAVTIPDEIVTNFTKENFRRGAIKNEGRRPDEIALSIIAAISEL